jgi:aspartyl-tRNA(Asn)/glutamyl-tRNA(Gln) amidotransferase subunit A
MRIPSIASVCLARRSTLSDKSLVCYTLVSMKIDAYSQDTISHPDSKDMSCASSEARKEAMRTAELVQKSIGSSGTPLAGLRIGIPIQTQVPAPSIQLPHDLLQHLQTLGAELHAIDLPSFNYALPAYYVLASAEASSNLARYGGGWFGSRTEKADQAKWGEGVSGEDRRRAVRTRGFGQEVKKRILAGTHALSSE